MKLSKFISVILSLTCFSLIYVYQQTEIFRLGYVSQKRQVNFGDLLDKNTVLRYNMGRNTSLVRIGDKISQGNEFEMPGSFRLVKMKNAGRVIIAARQPKKQNIFARLFAVTRQAEAKTINP